MAMLNRRKQLLFWIPAALIPVALMVAVYIQVRRPPTTRRALYIIGEPEKGAALFFGDKQCGICHSVNGSGGRVAPDLSGKHPGTPAMGWLVTVLWNHGPGMWRQIRQKNKPYPQLDSQEMADILAFLYQASSIDRAGDPSAGQRVFNEKGCVRCHSVGGTGGKVAPELSGIAAAGDIERLDTRHAEPRRIDGCSYHQHPGAMAAVQLVDEMNDLIAYVSLSAPQPATKRQAKYPATQSGVGLCFRADACSAIPYAGRVAASVRSWGRSAIFHSPRRSLPVSVEPCAGDASAGPRKRDSSSQFFRATRWRTCWRFSPACGTSSPPALPWSASASLPSAAAQLAMATWRKAHRSGPPSSRAPKLSPPFPSPPLSGGMAPA